MRKRTKTKTFKKSKLLSVLDIFIQKNSPYLLNNPHMYKKVGKLVLIFIMPKKIKLLQLPAKCFLRFVKTSFFYFSEIRLLSLYAELLIILGI